MTDTTFTPQGVLNRAYDDDRKAIQVTTERVGNKTLTYTGGELTQIDAVEAATGVTTRTVLSYTGGELTGIATTKI